MIQRDCEVQWAGLCLLSMNLKLLSWNVRGFNNPHKRDTVKNLLKKWKCDVVCFQETKLDCTNSLVVKSRWGSPFVDWVALDAVHTVGGVLVTWDIMVFEKIDCVVGTFSVSILLKGVANGFVWICTGLYGPTDAGLRDALWAELNSVRARWSSTRCVFGDFNIIRYPVE